MSLLDDLGRGGHLRTIDLALADTLRRHAPDTPAPVLAAAALASLAVARGHAAFDPARPHLLVDADVDWPEAEDWCKDLAASPWVAVPAAGEAAPNAPLVLDGGLLYLRRYREYERRLAARLQRLASQMPADDAGETLVPVFEALFPPGASDPLQARAASLAPGQALRLVTGGPGTGKTTTIARMLVLLVARAALAGGTLPRIALAAPTGRAAERMAESLRNAIERLRGTPEIAPAWLEALPTRASTLHRLLGTIPDSPRFRHDADHPLPFDVVVVDEASMVDLPLMCKLAEAVGDGGRLVLIGDPDQLPSVEAGDVLAAICAAAGGETTDAATDAVVGGASAPTETPPAIETGTTGDLFAPQTRAGTLAGHRVHLLRGYRQSADIDLAPLAAAVRTGDADAALELLRAGTLAGVTFHEDVHDPLQAGADALLQYWRALVDAPSPADALAEASRLRLLTAVRHGPQGALTLNARIEEALAGPRPSPYFHGRLLLVTENSYRHRLFNGDIGICLHDARGVPAAWFPGTGADGAVRAFHPSALPAHEGAFAMTVHKAQGSEFERVWLQLPRHDNRVLSRELVYTALTRAGRELHVCASAQVLRAALDRHVARVSGLAARLRSVPVRTGSEAT